MRVCVLQPDYTGSSVPYARHDPPRDLAPLLPGCHVDHLFLKKISVCPQLRDAARRGYDIFVNLCEGYLDWDVPSIEVIWFLEYLDLPYTGPPARLYDPSKTCMKAVAKRAGVPVPRFVEASSPEDLPTALRALTFPMFVKPAHAGDSLGIDRNSLVTSEAELARQLTCVLREYDRALIEEYVDGRECTVLVAADPGSRPVVYPPIEFLFDPGCPWKTYELKVEHHAPERNVPLRDPDLSARLMDAARQVFTAFDGEGYARLDFRVDSVRRIYFLEVNFTCSVFYPPGSEGSADYILRYCEAGHQSFLRHIIQEGRRRFLQRRERAATSLAQNF